MTFKIYVQPRSSKSQVVGCYGDALKVKIKAPPVEGAANKMCIQFLAACFDLPKSCVEIISGQSGRTKRVRVRPREGTWTEKERKRLNDLIQSWLD